MTQTFRDRLMILMKGVKPYTWRKIVGIDKSHFQYCWQWGNIPNYITLLKIQEFTGCSLDWLLAGRKVAFDQIDDLPMTTIKNPEYGARNLRLANAIEQIRTIYQKKADRDIQTLEYFVEALQ